MTKQEQCGFIKELIGNVQDTLLVKLHNVPDSWDGIELREWISDEFHTSSYVLRDKYHKARYRAYKNEVLVRNI